MHTPLKIGMIAACPFPYPRGTPVRIFRMAEALADHGHEVHVITYHLGDPHSTDAFEVHRIPAIPFYHKRDPGPSFLKLAVVDPALAAKVLAVHRRVGFDLLHAHHYEGLLAALPARLATRCPVVFDAHTLLDTELHHYRLPVPRRMTRSIARRLDRWLPGLADQIVCVSPAIRDALISQYNLPESRTSVLPNGVELERFLALPPDPQDRQPGEIILAYAGNFSPYQRIDVLLQAFALIAAQTPEARLVLYTEDDPARLQPLLADYPAGGAVCLQPTSFEDLPGRLAEADILLNPRLDGAGHPLKLLNYMAAGKPIVSFSGSAHGLEDQTTALLIAEETPEAFALGVLELIANPALRKFLGENARAYVAEHHVWSVNARLLTELYHQLLTEKGRT